jgi:prepilin-type N-terminal cleavage/methylation domain-containing protein
MGERDGVRGAPFGSGEDCVCKGTAGFTLIELLVVITIIGILAAIGLPALRGLGGSKTMMGAERQILEDLGQARLRALNERTTVYLVFIPPGIYTNFNNLAGTNPREKSYFTNLLTGQYTSYNFFTRRGVGEQPGRENPRYLSDWRSLPDGIFIPKEKFIALDPVTWSAYPNPTNRPFAYTSIAFPFASSKPMALPYIAFNSLGQLANGRDEFIALAKGSVFMPGNPLTQPVDIVDPDPNGTNRTYVRINWITGRAKIEKRELK